jgi:uncharacterized protein with HEPN domain
MTKALRVPDYLAHMLKAIERINRYTDDMATTGWTWKLSGRRFMAICRCFITK